MVETNRVDHLRKSLLERVCVCHHNIILWNDASLVFMDSWRMAHLTSKRIMHFTVLGINFLAMQMQCAHWYHQKPHHWVHLWTFIIQTGWEYFHHLYTGSLVLKARIYTDVFSVTKSHVHIIVLLTLRVHGDMHILFHQWDMIYPSVSNCYSTLLLIRKNSASFMAATAYVNVTATFSATPMCVVE